MTEDGGPDMGDFVVCLLASTLAGLRDRLASDRFEDAADLVADLVEIVDDYVTHLAECAASASAAEIGIDLG